MVNRYDTKNPTNNTRKDKTRDASPEARKLVLVTINMQQQMGILCEGQQVVPCENIKNCGYVNPNTEVGKTGYKRRNLRGAVAKTISEGYSCNEVLWEGQMRRGNPAYCCGVALADGKALQY